MNLQTLQEKINLLYSKSHLKQYVFPRFSVYSSPDTSFANGKPYDLNSQNREPVIEKQKQTSRSPPGAPSGKGKVNLMVSSLRIKSLKATEILETQKIQENQIPSSPDQKPRPQHSINRVLKRKHHKDNKSQGYISQNKSVTNYLQNQSGAQVLSKLFSSPDKLLTNTTIDQRLTSEGQEKPPEGVGKLILNFKLSKNVSQKNIMNELYSPPKMSSPRNIKGPMSERTLTKSSKSIIEKQPKIGMQQFFMRPLVQLKEQGARPKAMTMALEKKADSFRSLLFSKKQIIKEGPTKLSKTKLKI